MRIRQTNNLTRITRVRENFLVTGETGIENDFAAPARDGAAGAAVKDAPVFERQNGEAMLSLGQCVLRTASFVIGLGGRQPTLLEPLLEPRDHVFRKVLAQ